MVFLEVPRNTSKHHGKEYQYHGTFCQEHRLIDVAYLSTFSVPKCVLYRLFTYLNNQRKTETIRYKVVCQRDSMFEL